MKTSRHATVAVALGCGLLASTPVAAAELVNLGYRVTAHVPVVCTVNHVGTGFGEQGDAVGLGTLRQFCNAPSGYELVVNYTPGALRGMVLIAGDSRITLDGSGRAVVNQSDMPRARDLSLSAVPGDNGFDTDRLDFQMLPHS